MEKRELSTPAVKSHPRRTWKVASLRLFSAAVVAGLLWCWKRDQRHQWLLALGKSSFESEDDFHWSQIQPSENLNYTPCFEMHQCARLNVPLDWNETSSNGPQVAIAIIKLAAPVPITDPSYGGVILLNPGGPGGSGVNLLLRDGRNMSKIVNPIFAEKTPRGKYFDLLSWDPRGVNNTTPGFYCFKDSSSYDVWRYQEQTAGLDHTSDTSLSLAWARSKALMETCAQDDHITKYMNTVLVARDMVEIIERHAEWRSKQADNWLASNAGKSATAARQKDDPYSREAVIDRTKWRKDEEKLQYWGFSYGTVLGATFAAMYPNRVARVVLDGVANAHDYYNTNWTPALLDTDKLMLKFYQYCSQGGPDKCALNIGNVSSSSIQNSVEARLSSVRQDPISVPGNSTRSPTIITYSDLMALFPAMLYEPLKHFTELAELLADVVHGNGTYFAVYKQKKQKPTCPFGESPGGDSSSCQLPDWGIEKKAAAILCTDGKDVTNSTKADFKMAVNGSYQRSKFFGEYWATITLSCIHWDVRPKWGITADEIKGDTLHPILWIGNTLDPVTPLASAYLSSKRFPDSVVLEQDSEGHCSVSSPSECTEGFVRNYFQTGNLPAVGTVCQPNERPLIGKIGMTQEDSD